MSHSVHTKAALYMVVEGVGGRFRSGRVEEGHVTGCDVYVFRGNGDSPSQWQDAILKKIKNKCVLQNKGSRKPIGRVVIAASLWRRHGELLLWRQWSSMYCTRAMAAPSRKQALKFLCQFGAFILTRFGFWNCFSMLMLFAERADAKRYVRSSKYIYKVYISPPNSVLLCRRNEWPNKVKLTL